MKLPLGTVLLLGILLAACSTPAKHTPPHYQPVAETAAPLPADPTDIQVLNRITWGANTPSAQHLKAVGLQTFLAEQLHPAADDGLPAMAQDAIAGMDITQKPMVQLVAEARALQERAKDAKGQPGYEDLQKEFQRQMTEWARQAAARSLLRDLYSRNQLKEQLTWFWMNHFNVSASKARVRVFVGDYEENAIRPHVLGKFRDLLAATAMHPAMLEYLDNAQNAAGHINENYAREIMELHTMGVGSGYTQSDVQELARILTGLGVERPGAKPPRLGRAAQNRFVSIGMAAFRPGRHDYGDKHFLGTTIHGSGFPEIEQAITILSREPATARFVSKKLAMYFCCDAPPPALIDAMAATFQATDGDIAQVLETLFRSPEFRASLGQKFKDPMHYLASALRLAYGDTVILDTQPLLNWLNRAGEPLYRHDTPDGYSLEEMAWTGPGQMETRFEIARAIGAGRSGLFRIPGDMAKDPVPPPAIRQSRFYEAIAPSLRPATVDALAQAKSPADWNMLFLSSPEFMRR
jgi:uncharacterized protein (DUF1800 family)